MFIYVIFVSSHQLQTHFLDKNQYVHRRDSVSVTSLSEQEIQRRMQLGLITPSLGGNSAVASAATAAGDADHKQSEDWQDITDEELMQECADGGDDDPNETESSMEDNQNPYLLDPHRRSSIDLGHLSFNMHDESVLLSSTNSGKNVVSNDQSTQHSNKRLRYRQPSIASISEEEQVTTDTNSNSSILMDNGNDDDEVATVDGNDDEDIMEDI